MKTFRRAGAPALIFSALLLFYSCSGDMLLSGDGAKPEFLVQTISAGSVLGPGAEIPLALSASSADSGVPVPPSRMEVRLEGAGGMLVADTDIEGGDLAAEALPSLRLPESLDEGMYTLVFRLYRDGELFQESSLEFFSASGSYRLNGISSYPPSLYPDSAGILEALLDVPENANPYLVWRSGDRVFKTGYLQDGAGQAEWKAPDTEGVYNVRLELFPVGPADGTIFPFSSSIHIDTELFVSKNPAQGEYEFSGGEEFYSLFHFRGNLRDEGARKGAADTPIEITGRPALAKDNDIFGYYFDGNAGLSLPAFLLPVSDGKLQPFTVETRLQYMPEADFGFPASSWNLFRTESEDGTFSLAVKEEGGSLLAEVVSGPVAAVSRLNGFSLPTGMPVDLALSVVPDESGLTFSWFLDGNSIATERRDISFGPVSPAGQSTIGGEGGFTGIIDEFGVYSSDPDGRPSTDPGLFSRARKFELGRNLLFADGFDGLFLPGWTGDGDNLEVSSGRLMIGGGADVRLPAVALSEEEGLELDLTVPEGAKNAGALTVRTGKNGEPALTIPLSEIGSDSSSVCRIQVVLKESGIAFGWRSGSGKRLEEIPAAPGSELTFSLINTGKEERFAVDSICMKTVESNSVEFFQEN